MADIPPSPVDFRQKIYYTVEVVIPHTQRSKKSSRRIAREFFREPQAGRAKQGAADCSASKNKYFGGAAQLVARLLWECRGDTRGVARQTAAKSCDTCVCGTFSDCRKRHKSGFDHRNDHRQKIFDFHPHRGIMAEIEYPGVAKLVSRLIWECRGCIRDRAGRNAAKSCNTGVCWFCPSC